MSSLKGVVKGGWHPESKDSKRESWRGDFKGLNQVVRHPYDVILSVTPTDSVVAGRFHRQRQRLISRACARSSLRSSILAQESRRLWTAPEAWRLRGGCCARSSWSGIPYCHTSAAAAAPTGPDSAVQCRQSWSEHSQSSKAASPANWPATSFVACGSEPRKSAVQTKPSASVASEA